MHLKLEREIGSHAVKNEVQAFLARATAFRFIQGHRLIAGRGAKILAEVIRQHPGRRPGPIRVVVYIEPAAVTRHIQVQLLGDILAGAQADDRVEHIPISVAMKVAVPGPIMVINVRGRIPVAEAGGAGQGEGMFLPRLDEQIGDAAVGDHKFQIGGKVPAELVVEPPAELHVTDIAERAKLAFLCIQRQREGGVEMIPQFTEGDVHILLVAEDGDIPINLRRPERNGDAEFPRIVLGGNWRHRWHLRVHGGGGRGVLGGAGRGDSGQRGNRERGAGQCQCFFAFHNLISVAGFGLCC